MVNYAESDLTIKEMYALGVGADLSAHTGKLAKGSNYLITGDVVECLIETKPDTFGNEVQVGNYIYN